MTAEDAHLDQDEAWTPTSAAKFGAKFIREALTGCDDLSARQQALLRESLGLLGAIESGRISGGRHVRDNLLEVMTLFGDRKPSQPLCEAIAFVLGTGALIGMTDNYERTIGRTGAEWRDRGTGRHRQGVETEQR